MNPITYSYSKLKYNAGQRGIAFDLTLAQWRAFCERTGYAHRRGKEAASASVDRIDPSKGYTIENIQVITLSENTLKKVADAKKGYVAAKIKGHIPPWERDDFDVGDYLG